MSKTVGYARVSTGAQTTDTQVASLKEAGCEVVFEENISSRKKEKDRPQLQAALAMLRNGDELVLAKLDRLGRSQVEGFIACMNFKHKESTFGLLMVW